MRKKYIFWLTKGLKDTVNRLYFDVELIKSVQLGEHKCELFASRLEVSSSRIVILLGRTETVEDRNAIDDFRAVVETRHRDEPPCRFLYKHVAEYG